MTPAPPAIWRLRTRALSNRDHTLIIGILNMTPDSFSDGGIFTAGDERMNHEAAIARGLDMHLAGADVVDVGGESTRPGSMGVDGEVEFARVGPVIAALADRGVVVSVDTSKPDVAAACLAAGAEIVNDVTGLSAPGMVELCAARKAGVVLVHMKGEPRTMQTDPRYDDVVVEVMTSLQEFAERALAAGVVPDRICLDPGIGFGKTIDHNFALFGALDRIAGRGDYPLLIGASRKAFLGTILEAAGHPAAPHERDAATGATVALAIAQGAFAVRVHDVAGALQSARTADAIVRAWQR